MFLKKNQTVDFSLKITQKKCNESGRWTFFLITKDNIFGIFLEQYFYKNKSAQSKTLNPQEILDIGTRNIFCTSN